MSHDWPKSEALLRKSANRREIAEIASRQKQLIRLEQLLAIGLSARATQLRVDSGRLHRIHAGVLATHSRPYSRHQLYLAAVFACGSGSALSDLPAAGIHGIFETPPLIAHVSNRTGSGRSRPGIVVHRRTLEPRDITIRHGIPCTSPARTILDCSRTLDFEATEDLLMAADSLLPSNGGGAGAEVPPTLTEAGATASRQARGRPARRREAGPLPLRRRVGRLLLA